MNRRWRRLGLVFCPSGNHVWMRTHAQNPIAAQVDGDLYRVFFSCRDAANRSSVGYVDIDLRQPTRVLATSEDAVLKPGAIGTFDDSGVTVSCLLREHGRWWLYYLGWNLGVTVPWRNSIGLAVSDTLDGSFVRVSQAPVLDRNAYDPYTLTYPWVRREGRRWRMWYGSSLQWGAQREDMTHVIKYAESEDGVGWKPTGAVMMPLDEPAEFAHTRPCIVRDDNTYRMWFSVIGAESDYRMGYAESPDGLDWARLDAHVGIAPAGSGWDGESVEYPCVFDHDERRYMLYNGDGYGRSGFGIAVLD